MNDTCPHCGTDLRETWTYTDGTERTGWSTIGVEIPGVYDGVCYWLCPDCDQWWHRFPEGDQRRERVNQLLG